MAARTSVSFFQCDVNGSIKISPVVWFSPLFIPFEIGLFLLLLCVLLHSSSNVSVSLLLFSFFIHFQSIYRNSNSLQVFFLKVSQKVVFSFFLLSIFSMSSVLSSIIFFFCSSLASTQANKKL